VRVNVVKVGYSRPVLLRRPGTGSWEKGVNLGVNFSERGEKTVIPGLGEEEGTLGYSPIERREVRVNVSYSPPWVVIPGLIMSKRGLPGALKSRN